MTETVIDPSTVFQTRDDPNFEFGQYKSRQIKLKLREGQKLLMQDEAQRDMRILTDDMIKAFETQPDRAKTSNEIL